MFEQILLGVKDITGPRFYFITSLIFLLLVGFIFQGAITTLVKSSLYTELEYREFRNVLGLDAALQSLTSKDSNVLEYGVYIYQPKNGSFYKLLTAGNSAIARNSPAVSRMYLKDQPYINEQFKTNDFFIADELDIKTKTDFEYSKQIGAKSVLFFKLKIRGTTIGEIVVRFKTKPSVIEVEKLIHDLSPLTYLYVI